MSLEALGWNDARQQAFGAYADERLVPGRVVGEHRTHYRVATEFTELSAVAPGACAARPRSARTCPASATSWPCASPLGDGPATIEAVLPRTSALVRKAAGEQRPQLLAANIDVIFIVTGWTAISIWSACSAISCSCTTAAPRRSSSSTRRIFRTMPARRSARSRASPRACPFMPSVLGPARALAISSSFSTATGPLPSSARRGPASPR